MRDTLDRNDGIFEPVHPIFILRIDFNWSHWLNSIWRNYRMYFRSKCKKRDMLNKRRYFGNRTTRPQGHDAFWCPNHRVNLCFWSRSNLLQVLSRNLPIHYRINSSPGVLYLLTTTESVSQNGFQVSNQGHGQIGTGFSKTQLTVACEQKTQISSIITSRTSQFANAHSIRSIPVYSVKSVISISETQSCLGST